MALTIEVVIDASALLALLNSEPGAELVAEALSTGAASAVNLCEVVAKLCDAGMPEKSIDLVMQPLGIKVPFDNEQAFQAGMLRVATKGAGLSLGDRACLNLAKKLGVPALTADRSWAGIDVGVEIKVIR